MWQYTTATAMGRLMVSEHSGQSVASVINQFIMRLMQRLATLLWAAEVEVVDACLNMIQLLITTQSRSHALSNRLMLVELPGALSTLVDMVSKPYPIPHVCNQAVTVLRQLASTEGRVKDAVQCYELTLLEVGMNRVAQAPQVAHILRDLSTKRRLEK